MTNRTTRQLWCMRALGEKQSLMFSLRVCAEPEDDFFAAFVVGMEDHMAASGRTTDEAIANAIILFRATVDDAIKNGMSVNFATGQTPVTLDIPIWMAPKFFHLLERKLMNDETDIEQWWSIPTSEADSFQLVE